MTTFDKFVTMIGFAKRSGKIVYGYDNLKLSKKVKLYAVSDSASDNLKREMDALADKNKRPIAYVAGLENTVGNNVKALGFTDVNMAQAVVEYISTTQNDNYKLRHIN